jgi:CheY-like chemotaxis protein
VKRSEAHGQFGNSVLEGSPETDLAGALHEVSNVLTVVLGWLDAAQAGLPPGPEATAIDVAKTHARLGHHIARRAIGAEAASLSEQTARALARCAVLGVSQEAQRRGVKVQLEELNACRVLLHDTEPVLQILLNLLLNAIEFSPEGSAVTLSVLDDCTSVVFTVTDCGPGIEPERAKNLLAQNTSSPPDSTRFGGAGIGLRYSRALACAKGGDLSLVRPGPGASFTLRWPLAEARSGAFLPRVTAPTLSGARLLVVEDDSAVLSLIEVALEARGAQLVSVSNADQFANIMAKRAVFDAALVDLSPLAQDVAAAFDAFKSHNPNAPIVLISGVASAVPDDVANSVAAWVRKPFEMGEVIEALTHLLGDRGPKSDR